MRPAEHGPDVAAPEGAAALYVCYQSIRDPLTESQVLAYLEGLAGAGYRMHLLTFEPRPLAPEEAERWTRRLGALGIAWHRLPYHRRPSLLATLWDVLRGIAFCLSLVRRCGVRLVHARLHVPCLIGAALQRLCGVRLLFDVRGFMAEEYVDASHWREGGLRYRLTKHLERRLVRRADALVVLAERAREVLRGWYPAETADKPVAVIPCCVRLSDAAEGNAVRDRPGRPTLAYVGKLDGWYDTGALVRFAGALHRRRPGARLRVYTQSDGAGLRRLAGEAGLDGQVEVGRVDPAELVATIRTADAGLCFYLRPRSAAGCSPTKVGEYLAAGLPVVCNPGVGDVDTLLQGGGSDEPGPVGVLVSDPTPAGAEAAAARLLALLEDPSLARRCRAAAEEHLSLERIGWPRYAALYRHLTQSGTRES